MKVLVTGSSAYLAKVLLPLLCQRSAITKVIGIDIKPSQFKHDKFEAHIADIRNPDIEKLFENVDAVIHLAFVVLRSQLKADRKNRNLVHDININGSINVFELANKANAKSLIHLSSAVVYGAKANNPELIKEDQPRKIMQGFSYAEDKNEVEDWLELFEQKTNMRIVRLRPHVILGPNSQPFLMRLIQQPFYPALPEPQPTIQCIWEDDVANAIMLALFSQTSGTYNLAAFPVLTFKQIIQSTHRFSLPLPLKILGLLHRLLWKITGIAEEPGWLDGMQHSLAIDCQKAKNELAWQAKGDIIDKINALKK